MNVLTELFVVFFKLGAFTIGGGIAMLPLLQNTLIEEKKWFTKEEFVDIVAVCQSLPGVVAINMATYVGYKKKGFAGSVISTLGVTLPSFALILIIAHGITALGDNSIVMGAMAGLRAAALGLVVVAVIQLAPSAVKSRWAMLAAALSFVLIAVLNINTAYVILLFVLLGIASAIVGSRKAASAACGSAANTEATAGAAAEALSKADAGANTEATDGAASKADPEKIAETDSGCGDTAETPAAEDPDSRKGGGRS